MKYKIDKSKFLEFNGMRVYRICALKDFILINGLRIRKGDFGGYVLSETNLSQEGSCWILPAAVVWGEAEINDDAIIYGGAMISGNASVHDKAQVFEDATVTEKAYIINNAKVYGNAHICGHGQVVDDAEVFGDAIIYNNAIIGGNAKIFGDTVVYGNAEINCGEYSHGGYYADEV